ncbi:HD domain-containing phosphohydrolase [Fusibacter bizertensis]
MSQSIFGYISSIALLCYLFMLMIFINAEKNKIINAFLLILSAMILWTGGSLLMRLQFWPNYVFWYHVSLGGLMLIIFSYFRFIVSFTGKKASFASIVYFVLLMMCFLINIPNGLLLKWPNLVEIDGKTRMVYDKMTNFVAILFLVAAIVIIHMLYYLFSYLKKNKKLKKQAMPIVFGIFTLFAGNLALVLPIFSGFPIDIVAGVINAGFLMFALIRRHLFKLKLMATESVGYLFCVVLGFPVFYSLLPYLDEYVVARLSEQQGYELPVYLLSFVVVVSMLFYFWKKVISSIFVREEESQNDILKQYTIDVSKSLKLNEILQKTVEAISLSTGIKKIYIGLIDYESNDFILRYSDQSLADLSFVIRDDHPILRWLSTNEDILIMDDFEHTVAFKSIWESEKYQLARLGVKYCIGLKENSDLIGVILFSDFGRKSKLKLQDLNMIMSINSVASIAIKNAHAYEKAYLEARTDDLTGVLNRRYFYELISEIYEQNKEGSVALIIINIDDFKLYNQLYGVKQGDQALINVADLIKGCIGAQGYVSRYSGKEFAILLPGYDVFSARKLTETIRDQISGITHNSAGQRQKSLTISAGISVAPFGAKSVKELLDNADHAVYQVKRKGKNAIRVFDTFINAEKSLEELDYNQVYDDYKSTVFALMAAIDAKDHYTFNHSDNVANYAVALATELRLNKDIVENIRQAALLHDIGKISIPESILNKPGKLNEEEFIIMQGHVEASIDIIRHLPSLDYVIPAVLGHHERFDGKGYPRRISGEDIPLTARILCLADSFDAMISTRCYKPDMPVAKALAILEEEAGKQFDPKLVTLFTDMVVNEQLGLPISTERLKVVKL